MGKGEAMVIYAETMHDGGIDLVQVDGILGDIVAEVVGFPVGGSRLDAAAGHPHAEIAGVVVATVVLLCQLALAVGGAPEFTAEDNHRFRFPFQGLQQRLTGVEDAYPIEDILL